MQMDPNLDESQDLVITRKVGALAKFYSGQKMRSKT